MASPDGICTGYFPLLLSLSADLQALAASDTDIGTVRKWIVDWMGTKARCSASEIRAAAESDSLNRVISDIEARNQVSIPALCLPHLARLTMRIENTQTAKKLLASESAVIRRLAEEMQRYALRKESLRRDLITEEEELSYRFALQYLAGNKHVDPLWFLDGHNQ